jgi:hypothetical protein
MNMHDPKLPTAAVQVAPSFVTGWGQADTHAESLNDGRPNPAETAGTPYLGITGREIVALMRDPPSVPKEQAQWFIPSTHKEPDARSHEAQRERGEFWFLAIDVDKNNLALGDVIEAVEGVCGACTRLIYSSRSAAPDNRKWRVLVPLKAALAGADYADSQTALFDLLEEASAGLLIPDRALARPGQLVYLPNRGAFYDESYERMHRLDLTPDHPIIRRRDDTRRKRAAAEAEAQRQREHRQDRRQAQANEADVSPVDHFNERHTVEALLGRYGFTQARGSND